MHRAVFARATCCWEIKSCHQGGSERHKKATASRHHILLQRHAYPASPMPVATEASHRAGNHDQSWEREAPAPGMVGEVSQWPQCPVKTCGDGGPGVTSSFMGSYGQEWGWVAQAGAGWLGQAVQSPVHLPDQWGGTFPWSPVRMAQARARTHTGHT